MNPTRHLTAFLLVSLAALAPAWAGLCSDSLSAGGTELGLIGEVLLVVEEESAGGGAYEHRVEGVYLADDGTRYRVDCTGDSRNYVTSGTSV